MVGLVMAMALVGITNTKEDTEDGLEAEEAIRKLEQKVKELEKRLEETERDVRNKEANQEEENSKNNELESAY